MLMSATVPPVKTRLWDPSVPIAGRIGERRRDGRGRRIAFPRLRVRSPMSETVAAAGRFWLNEQELAARRGPECRS